MPTYDYYCEKCEKTFEIFQSMNDKKLKKCIDEECNGPVERLLGTGAGIIFKGSGFMRRIIGVSLIRLEKRLTVIRKKPPVVIQKKIKRKKRARKRKRKNKKLIF